MGRKTHIATAIDHARKGTREASLHAWCCIKARLSCAKGQGTTEYAILVGVLVVIAIIAITLFRPKIQDYTYIYSEGINNL